MGTLKAEAAVEKTSGDPHADAVPGVEARPMAGAAPDLAVDAADLSQGHPQDLGSPDQQSKQRSIKRSIVSLLNPAVSAANDDQATRARKQKVNQSQRLKYGSLLLASALLLIGAVYSLAQSDRFVTDLTVVSFVLILFFLIGLRLEATQGMLRDLSELVEKRSVGLDVGVDIEAAEQKVGTIDEAVARTLNRAGELQNLLQTDDLSFEKAYANREERFRAILDDMAVERAAITTNAEKMRLAMDSAHENLSNDLDAASRKFSQLLGDTGADLMSRIEEQLQKQSAEAIDICIKKLRSSLDGALIRAVEQVDARGATLAALISAKSEEFDEKLLTFKKEVALSLNGQIDDTQKAAALRIEAMTGCINRLLDRMNSGIAERSESLNQMLATRVLEIASTLKHGKTEMLQTIESAAVLSSDMSVKSEAANELLQKQIARLNESVVMPLGMLVEGLKERGSSLSHDLVVQFENVNGALKAQSRDLGTLFDAHIVRLNQTLATTSATIEGVAENNAVQFENVNDALKAQSRDLNTLFDGHIATLKQTMLATSATIEGVVENNNAAYESSLEALFKRHHRPLSDEMASVRSEFAAQRKLLAPLISNLGRSDRSLSNERTYNSERSSNNERSLSSERFVSNERSVRNDHPVSSEPKESPQNLRATSIASTTGSTNGDLGRVDEVVPTGQRTGATTSDTDSRGGQSWLTDILARASSHEEPSPKPVDEEIDANIFSAISTNIESLVSSDQISAAWMAFKRREVSRFEQIYTPQGEVVFSKLKTLLDADSDLKDGVTKYASQFETLLRERFQDGDERALFRYLTTPTGKVYTMLAHASNRLT